MCAVGMVPPSAQPVRILHTSDIHVGSSVPTHGLEPFQAVDALGTLSERLDADAVLIAGDFFDHPRVGDPIVSRAMGALARIPAPVVILPGNHDPYVPGSPWTRRAPVLPRNVSVITKAAGELVQLDGPGLQVWGQAHTDFEDFRPASARPTWRDGAHWRIAMAHGIHVSSEYHRRFSYQIRTEELVELGAHYVALGHIEEHRRVGGIDIHAYYASSPIRSGHFTLVDITPEGVAVRQVSSEA